MEGMALPKSYSAVILGKHLSSIYRELNRNGTNGLLRQYLPKKIPFDTLTQKQLDKIVDKINNRPRKVLGYLTPYEAFSS
jgi:IS30 family transposase